MPIPDIKFTIVAGGVPEVLNSLKTIQKAADTLYTSLQKMGANYTNKSIADWKKYTSEVINSHSRLERSVESSAKRMADVQIREAQRAANSISRMNFGGGGGGGGGGFGRSSFGGGGGFPRGGMMSIRGASMLLGASMLPGGSIVRAGIGGAELGFGLGGPGGAAAGAAAGVAIAGAAEAFSSAVNVFSAVANTFASAVTELGGWKGISGSLVSGSRADTLAAQSLAMTPTGNRGLFNFANISATNMGLRKGTIFSTEDVARARAAWVAKTGNITGFDENFDLISQMATVSGNDIVAQTQSAAQLKQQFPMLSGDSFRKTLMGQFSLSKLGEIPSTQVMQLAKATGVATLQPGREYENFMFLSALGQTTAAGMGGGTRSSTAMARFFERNFKQGGFGFAAGTDKNLRDVFEEATVQLKHNPTLAQGLGLPETQLLQIAGTHATGRTPQEQKQNLDKWIQSTLDLIESQDKLKQDTQAVSDVAENQLKISFNDLTDDIANSLGPVIKDQLVPNFKNLVAAISANSDQFGLLGKDMIDLIKSLAEMAPLFGLLSAVISDTVAVWISIPGLLITKLADELSKVMGTDSEVVKQIKALGDSFMTASKGLVDFGEGLQKVAGDFSRFQANTPVGQLPGFLAWTPGMASPAAAAYVPQPYRGGGGGGTSSSEDVRWVRKLVQTSVEGNVLMREQNRKLDNLNPPDPSRAGGTNK